jgi:hypothetical protein
MAIYFINPAILTNKMQVMLKIKNALSRKSNGNKE